MNPDHQRELQRILREDPGVAKRLHSPRKAEAHLRRRGFQTALGFRTPGPPLHWTSLPAAPSIVHGHAWLGLDSETLQKALALGFIPPRMKRPTAEQAWELAQGRCRTALLEGETPAHYQECRLTERGLELSDPLHPTIIIPKNQRCEVGRHPRLRIRCRATKTRWIALLDHQGNPIINPNHSGSP